MTERFFFFTDRRRDKKTIPAEMAQNGPPIDILTDEVLHYILSAFVGDTGLGSCLLAWRRFHVLGLLDLQRRKYRCATVPSMCVAGDVDGLKFALDNADIYLPLGRFDWNGCLFGAAAVGSVATLDVIKETIHARETDGSWPITPIMWWSLAFAAAQRGHDDVLAWLCLPCNATSSQPVVSAEQVQDLVPMANYANTVVHYTDAVAARNGLPPIMPSDNDVDTAEQALYALFDPVVVARVRTSLMDVGRDARDALCDRISRASGLDAWTAFRDPLFTVGAPAPSVQHSTDSSDEGDVDDSLDDADLGERLRQEIEADSDGRQGSVVWCVVERGLLREMEARFGADAIVRRMRAMPLTLAMQTATCSGHHDDAVWIYEMRRHEPSVLERQQALTDLASALARANRVDLLEKIGCGPHGTPSEFRDHTRESSFWTTIVEGAAEGGHVPVLESVRDRPIDKKSGRPMVVALENGHLGVAAWLCAHGFDRARALHDLGRASGTNGRSFLYRALCERRFDVARILLDPTADKGTSRDAVDERVSDAIAAAVRDALAAGDLATTTWLRERYHDTVDRTVASLRSDPWPARADVPGVPHLMTVVARVMLTDVRVPPAFRPALGRLFSPLF